MGIGALLGGILGLGRGIGGAIRNRRQQDQPEPTPPRTLPDPVNLSDPHQTVVGGGNPVAPQPLQAPATNPLEFTGPAAGHFQRTDSPLDARKNEFLTRFILNSTGDLFNGR